METTINICKKCNEVIVFMENEETKLCPLCKRVFFNIIYTFSSNKKDKKLKKINNKNGDMV